MKNPFTKQTVKGYKAFNKGLTCLGFQYELGKDFTMEGKPELCKRGFHFCKNLSDVYHYYTFDTENTVVCEVEVFGDVVDEEEGNKSVTNGIRLLRILNAEQAANNNGNKNIGHSNTGDRNTGDSNTGHSNTGHWNTGDRNTGHINTGHCNTGDRNTAHSNTGDCNTGDRNTGHSNTGDCNTGHSNTGDRNTGDSNTGHWNTGDRNTGDSNTGHCNTGHWNTGDRNTGHCNTGDRNTGHSNTGHWNTSNFNTGSFNTEEVTEVLVFNKICSKKEWDNAEKPSCLYFSVNEWINFEGMTDEEKKYYGTSKFTGGYMKKLDYKEAFTKSMKNASKEEIELVKKLPNFDAKVFEEISGFKIK